MSEPFDPLARPLLLRIQDAVTEVIQGVNEANGYPYDVSVVRGRLLFGEGDPVPLVSILEPPMPPETLLQTPDTGAAFGPWDLMIQGWIDDDLQHPTDPAQFLMAYVKRQLILAKRDRYVILGQNSAHKLVDPESGRSVVTDLKISRGVVRPPEEGISSKAHFWLMLGLSVAEDLEDPFA